MQNIRDLRNELIDNYTRMKESMLQGTMTIEMKAVNKELSNMAGKIMASISLEIKNQAHQGEKKPITFMQYED